jgi:hypothetical protein
MTLSASCSSGLGIALADLLMGVAMQDMMSVADAIALANVDNRIAKTEPCYSAWLNSSSMYVNGKDDGRKNVVSKVKCICSYANRRTRTNLNLIDCTIEAHSGK